MTTKFEVWTNPKDAGAPIEYVLEGNRPSIRNSIKICEVEAEDLGDAEDKAQPLVDKFLEEYTSEFILRISQFKEIRVRAQSLEQVEAYVHQAPGDCEEMSELWKLEGYWYSNIELLGDRDEPLVASSILDDQPLYELVDGAMNLHPVKETK